MPTVLRDQAYDAPRGLPLHFDLIRPDGEGPSPLVVCIHGGGWISGDKSEMHDLAPLFVGQGWAVACVQYRLAPLHPFPAAVEDVQAFVRYVRGHAGALGIDPTRIASFGNSAGGHLAVMLGVSDVPVDGVSSRVNAVIDLCAITDVTEPKQRHYPISWSFLEQFMGAPYEGSEELYRQASPITYVNEKAAPTLLIHGEEDDIVPISQSEALAGSLGAHKVRHRFVRMPGEGHAFSVAVWPHIESMTVSFLKEELEGVHA